MGRSGLVIGPNRCLAPQGSLATPTNTHNSPALTREQPISRQVEPQVTSRPAIRPVGRAWEHTGPVASRWRRPLETIACAGYLAP